MKQAVEHLDNMEESYSSVLICLGIRHSTNMSFCSNNFKLFTQSMLYIWQCNLKGTPTLIQFMIHTLQYNTKGTLTLTQSNSNSIYAVYIWQYNPKGTPTLTQSM